jgi:hypothetical protein
MKHRLTSGLAVYDRVSVNVTDNRPGLHDRGDQRFIALAC